MTAMERVSPARLVATGILIAVLSSLGTVAGLVLLLRARPDALGTSSVLPPGGGETVVEAVRRSNPAVVAITVSKDVPVYERYLEEVQSPFGRLRVPQVRQNGTREQEVGGGSGFLVSEDGYVVTNRHVVADEEAGYAVFTNDGTKYEATVVARDAELDLAVIRIEGTGFPYLSFGDSDALEVGQAVITIGNALAEFRNTVSVGVVSGIARSLVASDRRGGTEQLDQLIQTDAAVNEGNSGGPLLNLAGEVVGVNVAAASGAENIGFALNANSVKGMVAQVRSAALQQEAVSSQP